MILTGTHGAVAVFRRVDLIDWFSSVERLLRHSEPFRRLGVEKRFLDNKSLDLKILVHD